MTAKNYYKDKTVNSDQKKAKKADLKNTQVNIKNIGNSELR